MAKSTVAWVLALAIVACSGPLLAHHSLARYDTDTPIHLKGVIVRFERINPHSLIFLEQMDEKGQTVRWALEGPGPVQLARMGLDKIDLEIGTVIEACGYATKDRIDRTANATSGRAFNAEMLVLADGSRRSWSDYGQHHCLGKDFSDVHTRAPLGRSS